MGKLRIWISGLITGIAIGGWGAFVDGDNVHLWSIVPCTIVAAVSIAVVLLHGQREEHTE